MRASRAAAAVCVVLLGLTGCSTSPTDPVTTAASPTASPGGGIALGGSELPPGWPPGLPSYEGGTLISAVVSDDGLNINAVWQSEDTPDGAWAQMDAALRKNGFLPSAEAGGEDMLVQDETMRNDVYVSDTLEVSVTVVEGEATGVLLNASKL
jgi:hypothetical protein